MITNGLDLKKVLHSMDGISKDVLTKLSEQVLFVLNMLPFSATDQDEENISRQEGILSSVLQSIAKEVCSIFHITVKNVQLAFSHPSGSLGSFTLPSENKTCPDGFLISIGKECWQNVTRMAGGKYIDPLLLIETVVRLPASDPAKRSLYDGCFRDRSTTAIPAHHERDLLGHKHVLQNARRAQTDDRIHFQPEENVPGTVCQCLMPCTPHAVCKAIRRRCKPRKPEGPC